MSFPQLLRPGRCWNPRCAKPWQPWEGRCDSGNGVIWVFSQHQRWNHRKNKNLNHQQRPLQGLYCASLIGRITYYFEGFWMSTCELWRCGAPSHRMSQNKEVEQSRSWNSSTQEVGMQAKKYYYRVTLDNFCGFLAKDPPDGWHGSVAWVLFLFPLYTHMHPLNKNMKHFMVELWWHIGYKSRVETQVAQQELSLVIALAHFHFLPSPTGW